MKFKINKGFIVQKVGDKSTIFDGEESVLLTFNKTGAIIFEKIKLGWEKDKIVGYLSKTFSVNEKTAEEDFDEFADELVKSKILRRFSRK